MPLITICGYPSSGKSYRAKQIVRYLEDQINCSAASVVNGQVTQPSGGTISSNSEGAESSVVRELSEWNLKEPSASASQPVVADIPNSVASTAQSSVTGSSISSKPAKNLAQASNSRISRKLHYISDHSLHLSRSVYSAAKSEKDARAALYSAVKRVLGRNDIVVLDSGNYIKGWRYQLYCEAKNTGTGSCVVHVGLPGEKCRANNETRLKNARRKTESKESEKTTDENAEVAKADPANTDAEIGGPNEQDPYDETVFEELLMRFEEPNAMARWDSPLFTVPWDDTSPPCDEIWAQVIQGVGKDGKSRTIRPNQAAVLTPASSPSHLYILDRTTQTILAAIQAHQRDHPDDAGTGTPVSIPVPSSSASAPQQSLSLILPPQPLTFPHLQRLRRQFIALHRQQMGGLGMGGIGGGLGDGERGSLLSEARVAELFVGFLGERFEE